MIILQSFFGTMLDRFYNFSKIFGKIVGISCGKKKINNC